MRHHLTAAFAVLCCTTAVHAKDIKIAHVYDKTGALEAYAKQTHIGLMMGLEYATKGDYQFQQALNLLKGLQIMQNKAQ